jgi:hypothetical protein
MAEAKLRRQALQPDPHNMGIKGKGWKGLQPIDIHRGPHYLDIQ